MDQFDIINTRLDMIFKALRKKEGIEKGELCRNIAPIDEYNILMNRRYKMENGIDINELETEIALEEGNLVRMYIAQVYYELKINELDNMPFPEYNLTMEDLEQLINNNENNKYKVKM